MLFYLIIDQGRVVSKAAMGKEGKLSPPLKIAETKTLHDSENAHCGQLHCSFTFRSVKRSAAFKILNGVAAIVILGGCFDMLMPGVPSNLFDYLKVTRADASPQLLSLLLGLLRALGGALVAVGITALFIINGPLKRGETWACWALVILIGLSEGINASQMWRFGSPYYFPLAFVALTVFGVIILPASSKTGP